MGMEIDLGRHLSRGGVKSTSRGEIFVRPDSSTLRLLDYTFYLGSTTSRMAVRSSFSMITSMKAGRQIASIPVSRR